MNKNYANFNFYYKMIQIRKLLQMGEVCYKKLMILALALGKQPV